MTRAVALLGLLLACHCGSAPEEHAALEVEPVVDAVDPEPCGMVFSPEPALLDATAVASARWSAATGCDIRIGEGGIPVIVGPAQPAPASAPVGTMVGGGTARYDDGSCAEIWMTAEYDNEQTIAHEFGHCLGKPGHLEGGIMSKYAKGGIDAAALDMVCSVLQCTAYSPEL